MDDQSEDMAEAKYSGADHDADDGNWSTGAYETKTGVVVYDMDDPLAWVQGDNAVKLTEMT